MLAPVGLSVYKRLEHIQRTVEALQANTLASESRLYIFSDAPSEGDDSAVVEVREYLHTIDGFADINIIERETNSRVYNNRTGMRSLLDQYGMMIWLEEDIVTAPGFLAFMNGALDYYRDQERVISITGYTPPLHLAAEYNHDAFFLQRFNAWGFGTWKDKFNKIDMTINPVEYRLNMKNHQFYRKLINNGMDIPRLIEKDARGVIDALDVKIMYQQVLNDWYTVYPRISLTQNIGHDGSGLHCIMTDKFHHDRLWNKAREFEFLEDIYVDSRIVSANKRFRSLSIIGKFAEHMRRLRSYLF